MTLKIYGMKDIPQLNEHNKEEYPPLNTTDNILNQTMIRLFCCGRAVSDLIERNKSKLDFRFQREPEESEINQIEQQVNRIIQSGLPITTEYITQEEALGRFDLRRLPDNASETVRVVKVGDYDECLCIGRHVENTSEIGVFKIISYDFKDGILRLRFKLL